MKEDNFKRFADCNSLEEAIYCEILGVWYQRYLPNNHVDSKELEYKRIRDSLSVKEVNGCEAEHFMLATKWKIDDSELDIVITKYFQSKSYQLKSQLEDGRKVFQKDDTLLSVNVTNLSTVERRDEAITGSILQYKTKNGKIRAAVSNKHSPILEYKLIQGQIIPFKYSQSQRKSGYKRRKIENGK